MNSIGKIQIGRKDLVVLVSIAALILLCVVTIVIDLSILAKSGSCDEKCSSENLPLRDIENALNAINESIQQLLSWQCTTKPPLIRLPTAGRFRLEHTTLCSQLELSCVITTAGSNSSCDTEAVSEPPNRVTINHQCIVKQAPEENTGLRIALVSRNGYYCHCSVQDIPRTRNYECVYIRTDCPLQTAITDATFY